MSNSEQMQLLATVPSHENSDQLAADLAFYQGGYRDGKQPSAFTQRKAENAGPSLFQPEEPDYRLRE
jgi:hypothetical protein